jgi:hypothetical protein
MSKHPTPANPYVTDQRLFDPAVQPNKVKDYKMQLTNFAIFGVLGFMMQTALACSPPPPKIGADGKVVIAPYKYNYVAVVVGRRDVTVPFGRDRVPTPMQALVLEVLESSSTEVVVGSRQLVVYPGIGADCSPEPRAYNLDSYPLGSKVTVRADRLEAGFVEKV